jgi:hypothetical protein
VFRTDRHAYPRFGYFFTADGGRFLLGQPCAHAARGFFTTDGTDDADCTDGEKGIRSDNLAPMRLGGFFTTDGTDDADCTDGGTGIRSDNLAQMRLGGFFTTDCADILDYTDGLPDLSALRLSSHPLLHFSHPCNPKYPRNPWLKKAGPCVNAPAVRSPHPIRAIRVIRPIRGKKTPEHG